MLLYSLLYKRSIFLGEKKNPALVMIAHVILTRILKFEILKGSFEIISSKHAILQMRKQAR